MVNKSAIFCPASRILLQGRIPRSGKKMEHFLEKYDLDLPVTKPNGWRVVTKHRVQFLRLCQ